MSLPDKADDAGAQSRSVALLKTIWGKVDWIVRSEFTGNRSAYFSQLVDRDLAARGLSDNTVELHEIVEELARVRGAEVVKAKLAELQVETAEAAAIAS